MGDINNKFYLDHYLSQKKQDCKQAVENLTLNSFKVTTDDSLIERFYNTYKSETPQFGVPKWTPPKKTGDYAKDGYGFRINKEMYTVNVHVPISGDENLFFAMPSTSTVVNLKREYHSLSKGDLYLTIELPTDDKTAYEKELNELLNQFRTNLPIMENPVKQYNIVLLQQIKSWVADKKKRLENWS
jgi:hypothetical protein